MSTDTTLWQSKLAERAGITWFDYQIDCLNYAESCVGFSQQRMCLYYKTGAGKSITALACMWAWGYRDVLVICPPSTNDQWIEAGNRLGIVVTPMSHAKFRMKTTKLKKDLPVIADEMHLFGGHGKQGWLKLDRLAAGLQAPMVLASATPNYNDADRVYCIQHIVDPTSCRGGFLEFVYKHCTTEQNPFGMMPIVTGFQNYPDAAAYLADLKGVMYLPDDLVYTIDDYPLQKKIPLEMEGLGYDKRSHRMIASGMEERHTVTFQTLVNDNGLLTTRVLYWLNGYLEDAVGQVLIFANHATVAEAIQKSLHHYKICESLLVTGKNTTKSKQYIIDQFKAGKCEVLIGTASLATGTDGLDKVCDWLLIVDDTDDDSLRRQLVGRIMPRGKDTDASNKHVKRLVLQ